MGQIWVAHFLCSDNLWAITIHVRSQTVQASRKKIQANSVHIIGSIKLTGSNMGVSENVVYPKKPNGFADHYPYYINSYFIGNLPNIFRQSQISYITLW